MINKKFIVSVVCLSVLGCMTGCNNKNYDDAMSGVERENSSSAHSSVTNAYNDSTSEINTESEFSSETSEFVSETAVYTSESDYVNNNSGNSDDSHSDDSSKPDDIAYEDFMNMSDKSEDEFDADAFFEELGDNIQVPTMPDGSYYTGHEDNSPEDKYENLPEGLHNDAVHNNQEIKKFMFDNAEFEINNFTAQDFINNTQHEWHIYTKKGFDDTKSLAPGDTAFFHMDSDEFSDKANQKKETNRKNGQVVLYVKNNTGSSQSVYDCTVYKIYITYAGYGANYYNNIPIAEYCGLQILDDLSDVVGYFGDYRDYTIASVEEDSVSRYQYGTIEKTAVNIDVMNYQGKSVFIGFSIC
ncbi:MAG: hypothetical protein ACI4PX_00255 [Ruminococcus sp.]